MSDEKTFERIHPTVHSDELPLSDEKTFERIRPNVHSDKLPSTRKILVEDVILSLRGTASVHRMTASGRHLVGGGLAVLRVTQQDDESVQVTISCLDVFGINLDVPRAVWGRRLDVGSLRGAEPLGEVILHVEGEATEWEAGPDSRRPVSQDQGSLRVIDTGVVLHATLALRFGTLLEMDIAPEEWGRAFAASSGCLIANSVPSWAS
jgi:hypothetical protein